MIKRTDFIPAIIGFIIASMITYLIYLWQETPGVEFIQRSTAQSSVKPGDTATITWKEERSNQCEATVYRKLIAADDSLLEFVPEKRPAGEANEVFNGSFSFKVPVGLKRGPLIFRATLDLQCNWVQQIVGGHHVVLPDVIFDYLNGGVVLQ